MMRLNLRILSIVIMFLLSGSIQTKAQVAINEFMSDNTTTIADQDGDFSDWMALVDIPWVRNLHH